MNRLQDNISAIKLRSVSQATDTVRKVLETHGGFEQVGLQARLLVAAALDINTGGLSDFPDRILTNDERIRISNYLNSEVLIPVPFYLGYAEVVGLRVVVSRHTLAPGTETECLIRTVVALIRDRTKPCVLEIGTGCGVVAGAVAVQVPSSTVFATDVSKEALDVAKLNAQNFFVSDRVTLARVSWLDPLCLANLVNGVDVLVSNPPYVCSGDIEKLPADFREHAPLRAIDGGKDGLQCHRAIVKDAYRYIKSAGYLILQTDEGQAPEVATLICATGQFELPEFSPGSQGRPRIVIAKRKDCA